MMDKMEFEEKVDVDDLVLPSKPLKLAKIEINDIKQEPIEEEKQQDVELDLKGQIILKAIFVFLTSQKKQMKKIDLLLL